MFYHLKKNDWILTIVVFLLGVIGLLSIYSSSLGRGDFLNFKKQIFFFALGFLLMVIISFFDWRFLKENPYFILILYFLCITALIGLFFIGTKTRGVISWYKFGPISFDPVEPIKIILTILLAKYFSKRHIEMYRITHILLSGFYVFLPAVLVFLQPNLGSTLILISLWIGVLIISGIKLKHFLILIFLAILISGISWPFLLKDYQKERIVSFFTPKVDPLGSNWSQTQARIAIGSGGIFGRGFLKGSQTQYGFLPLPQTDFIFSAIAEEFGLLGIMVLFSLFIILIRRIIKIALLSQSNFPRIFAMGFAVILITQIFIHIGMNLSILPVIGIALPFVSYGGSGLISFFIAIGILQSIKTH